MKRFFTRLAAIVAMMAMFASCEGLDIPGLEGGENTEQEGGSGNTDKEPDGEKPGTGDEGGHKPGDNKPGDNEGGDNTGDNEGGDNTGSGETGGDNSGSGETGGNEGFLFLSVMRE